MRGEDAVEVDFIGCEGAQTLDQPALAQIVHDVPLGLERDPLAVERPIVDHLRTGGGERAAHSHFQRRTVAMRAPPVEYPPPAHETQAVAHGKVVQIERGAPAPDIGGGGIVSLARVIEGGSLLGMPACNPYRGFRYPAEVIQHAVWLYHCFSLSLRDVETILAVRGVVVSYESIREWGLRFGRMFANELKRRRPRPGDKTACLL